MSKSRNLRLEQRLLILYNFCGMKPGRSRVNDSDNDIVLWPTYIKYEKSVGGFVRKI